MYFPKIVYLKENKLFLISTLVFKEIKVGSSVLFEIFIGKNAAENDICKHRKRGNVVFSLLEMKKGIFFLVIFPQRKGTRINHVPLNCDFKLKTLKQNFVYLLKLLSFFTSSLSSILNVNSLSELKIFLIN